VGAVAAAVAMLRRLLLPLALLCLSASAAPSGATAKTTTHVVGKGQRLASIAKRYNVTVDAIVFANGIRERDPIKPGQRLVIPDRSDKDGSLARAANHSLLANEDTQATRRASLERPVAGRRRSGPSWKEYTRAPKRKNWVELTSHSAKWRGLVIDAKGRLRPSARAGISQLLGATGDHPGAPDRLLRLIVEVSNTFGGRPIHIVSGYRTTSFFRDSRHKTSQAIDFAIVGVPNAVARDYLMTLDNVGVGFYPNSTFLHLDVRPRSTHWTDYAGPGQAPRKRAGAPAATPVDFDELAEQAAEGSVARAPEQPSEPKRDDSEESALPATAPGPAQSP
jgi:LysM repeat protein